MSDPLLDLQLATYGHVPPLWPAGSLREPHSPTVIMLRHRLWAPRWDASGRSTIDWLMLETGEAILTEMGARLEVET